MMRLAYRDESSEWTFEDEEIVSAILSALAERGDDLDCFCQEVALRHPLTVRTFHHLYTGEVI